MLHKIGLRVKIIDQMLNVLNYLHVDFIRPIMEIVVVNPKIHYTA